MDLFWTTRPGTIGRDTPGEDSIIVLGFPFDSTVTGIPGQRLGPQRVRESVLSMDAPGLHEVLWDAGDLVVVPGNPRATLERLGEAMQKTGEKKACVLGGEHLLSLATVEHYARLYPDMWLVVLDAHPDYKNEYQGEKLSHATWLRRVHERSPFLRERTVLIGARAADEEEKSVLDSVSKDVSGVPEGARVYISVDVDAFDPSLCPGVGDPEPGGLSWRDFEGVVDDLENRRVDIVGFDIVEVNPLVEGVVTPRVAARILERLALLASTLQKP